MPKRLGVLLAVVLVTLAYVLLDDEAAHVDTKPPPTLESEVDVPAPLTVEASPVVVEKLEDVDVVVPTPRGDAAPVERSAWTVRWSLADEFGDALEYTELTRLGVFESMLPTGYLTVTDAAGADESEMELQDFRAEGFFSTTRRSPIDIVLRFGDVSFAGKAATEFSTVVLRATESLEQPGFAPVTFEGNRRVNIVAAVDLESLVSRQIIASPESLGPSLTAPFAPGHYSFVAEGALSIDRQLSPGQFARTHGEFTVEGTSPLTVRVEFHDGVTLNGTLQPPPAPGEKVKLEPIPRDAWMFARHRATVAEDGTFTIKELPPGQYTWVIARVRDDGPRVSTSAALTVVPEGDIHVTIVDAGIGEGGTITLLVKGARSVINVFGTDGTLRLKSGMRPDKPATVTMPRGTYTYIAHGRLVDTSVARRGTFTIDAEPTELTLDFTDG